MAATTPQTQSPQWGSTTKLTIVVFGVVIAGLLAWRFSGLVGQFAIAAMLAYILNPLVNWLSGRTRLSRGWAVVLTYLLLLIVGLVVTSASLELVPPLILRRVVDDHPLHAMRLPCAAAPRAPSSCARTPRRTARRSSASPPAATIR